MGPDARLLAGLMRHFLRRLSLVVLVGLTYTCCAIYIFLLLPPLPLRKCPCRGASERRNVEHEGRLLDLCGSGGFHDQPLTGRCRFGQVTFVGKSSAGDTS